MHLFALLAIKLRPAHLANLPGRYRGHVAPGTPSRMLSARIPVHHQVLNKTWSIINPNRRDAFGYGRRYLPSNHLNWHQNCDRPIGFNGNLRPGDSALDHYRDRLWNHVGNQLKCALLTPVTKPFPGPFQFPLTSSDWNLLPGHELEPRLHSDELIFGSMPVNSGSLEWQMRSRIVRTCSATPKTRW